MFVLNISLKSIFQRKCHNRVLVSVGLADWADRKYVLRTNNTIFTVIRYCDVSVIRLPFTEQMLNICIWPSVRLILSSRTENSCHCARIFFVCVPWTKQSKQYSVSKIMGSIQLTVPMVLCIHFLRWMKINFFPEGYSLLYKLYRYVPPHQVGFLRRFGLKTGMHFAHFGLESGMVFEGTTGVCARIYR